MGYLTDIGQYSSSRKLKVYYDFKHLKLNNQFQYEKGKVMNLVNVRNYATTYNCIPKSQLELDRKRIAIPARRNSTFEMVTHQPEGYFEGGWKSESTRLNQIKFYNEVLQNKTNLEEDGLSTLIFKTISKTEDKKYTFISIENLEGYKKL